MISKWLCSMCNWTSKISWQRKKFKLSLWTRSLPTESWLCLVSCNEWVFLSPCLSEQPSAVGKAPCSHFSLSRESCTIREKWLNVYLCSIFTHVSWSGSATAPSVSVRFCVVRRGPGWLVHTPALYSSGSFLVILLVVVVGNSILIIGAATRRVHLDVYSATTRLPALSKTLMCVAYNNHLAK